MAGGETSRIRPWAMSFISPGMNGIDLGAGGDCLSPSTIAMDLPQPYADYKQTPQQLYGDATYLYWFKDNVLDYVFSSHLLEDFEDPKPVLKEWLRVLKPGGRIILYLPIERKYREYCKQHGTEPNAAHRNLEMGPGHMYAVFTSLGLNQIETYVPAGDPYGFAITAKKPND